MRAVARQAAFEQGELGDLPRLRYESAAAVEEIGEGASGGLSSGPA